MAGHLLEILQFGILLFTHLPENNFYIWTLCESDGKLYISPGIRNVDVQGYYRCRYPWPHQNIQVDMEE